MRRLKILPWFVPGLLMSTAVWSAPPVNNVYENGVTLTITSKPFDPKTHVINMCEEEVCDFIDRQPVLCDEKVCDIDGKPVYGAYGLMPKQKVTSLVLETKDWKMALNVSNMYNPNVNNSNIKKYIQVTPWHEGSYRITGYFSHDDGDDDMYICLWLVTQDSSIRNYMGGYSALASLTKRVQEDFNIPPWPPWKRHPDDRE